MTKLSAYLTCRAAVSLDYPVEASVRSLEVFDEIVLADATTEEDGTRELLNNLEKELAGKLKVVRPNMIKFDYSKPNFGVLDGQLKAFARSQCTGEYLFQVDLDEILMPCTREQIESICTKLTDDFPIIALPVVEPWNNPNKIRIDVNCWKWRLSKNLLNITHGIPLNFRKYKDGLLYANHGVDGCEYIDKNSGQFIQFINFVKPETEQARLRAITDLDSIKTYEAWFNNTINKLPTIYHLSWWSIYGKMKKYKQFWSSAWDSLYGDVHPDGYPFFNKPWADVTDEEMRLEAKRLEDSGGHVFHTKWNGTTIHNTISISKPIPELAKEWCDNHKD